MLKLKATAIALGLALLTGAAHAENPASTGDDKAAMASSGTILLCRNVEVAEVGEFAPLDIHKQVMDLQAGQPCADGDHNPDNDRR